MIREIKVSMLKAMADIREKVWTLEPGPDSALVLGILGKSLSFSGPLS